MPPGACSVSHRVHLTLVTAQCQPCIGRQLLTVLPATCSVGVYEAEACPHFALVAIARASKSFAKLLVAAPYALLHDLQSPLCEPHAVDKESVPNGI